MKSWTEYCSELYNHKTSGDPVFTHTNQSTDTDSYDILRHEVEAAIRELKKGKSAGVDNIPGERVQSGGEEMVNMLHKICNKNWSTGEWPNELTQSLVITLVGTYNNVRITELSAFYVTQVRSCSVLY